MLALRRSKLAGFGSKFRVLSLAIVFFALISCGKKTAPKPPEEFAPKSVEFFEARGSVDGVELSWYAPTTKFNGDDLDDLEQFVVMRREVNRDEQEDFSSIAELVIEPSERPAVDEASAGTPEAKKPKFGKQYAHKDMQAVPGKAYEYYVAAENLDGVESLPSSIIRVKFVGESSLIEKR